MKKFMVEKIKHSQPQIDETEIKYRKKLGGRMREVRKYLGFSQDEVAKKTGMSRIALLQIESGRNRIGISELNKIALFYRYPVAYFTGETLFSEASLEKNSHLARAVASLSEKDRQELRQFANYLQVRTQDENSSSG